MTRIPLDSPAVAHGVGLFETMLVRRGRILFPDEHFARMERSAAMLGFPPPDVSLFHRDVRRACAGVTGDEAALRCLYLAAGASIAEPWMLVARCGPLPPLTLSRRTDGRVATLDPSLVRALPEHKLTSYAPCVIGLRLAAAAGADEGVFLTRGGEVLEGTATNVFATGTDRLITAPVSAGVLPGITRGWVIAEAARLGIVTETRPPTVAEMHAGSFLTGSLTGLAPVRLLDGRACAPPSRIFPVLMEGWTGGFAVA